MSHIQGQPHPAGATEHLDYAMAHVDNTGAVTQVVVVSHHSIGGINLPNQTTIYHANPGPGQRSLAAVLSATRRTNLRAALGEILAAATAADTPTDPAPPLPFP